MSEILTKINKKINFQKKLKLEIENIDSLLSKEIHILNKDEIEELKKMRINLDNKLIKSKLSFEDKFKDFIYNFEEINQAKKIEWLVQDVIPEQSIGVFFGDSGSGKSALILEYCIYLLNEMSDIFIIYIDADMNINKLKEIAIHELIKKYEKRFLYSGKQVKNIVETTQIFLNDIIDLQRQYKDRKYLVIEDSLTLLSKKKNGFIDTNLLYKNEKYLREAGATVVVIHHINKVGEFADTQQIKNYSDYTYLVERNDFNSCILLKPQKASRFDIKEKAYQTLDRKIIREIDYSMANISHAESNFVKIIVDILKDYEMNQSEIMRYLKQSSFFTKYSVGEKKVITWLEKWAKEGKWNFEQRTSEKNAKVYYINQTEKHAKLLNIDMKDKS